jgi:4-hydroxy-3-methylbut-2-enyl diphosphate reductase
MLDTPADLAIVVGGYNSSNTSHLVELCEERMPTFFIRSEENIISPGEILHYDFHEKREQNTTNWLPKDNPARILLTSGASCPDILVEAVIRRIAAFYGADSRIPDLVAEFTD